MRTHKQAAAEAMSQAIEESANVVDMPRPVPATVQLTETEKLEAENIQLKSALVQSQFEAAMRKLKEADTALAARIGQRTGADMRRYMVDINTGTCRLKDEN